MQGQLEACDALDAQQFLIAVRRLADTLNYGTDHSPFRGAGVEYVQSRPYVPGDSIRAIDWRVTARTNRVFVKEYEAPKRMPVYLLLDTSASMKISSGGRSKYSHAVQIAGGLALACLHRVSPVGIIGVGSEQLRVVPSLSKAQILQWLHRLRMFRYDELTTLGDRLRELSPQLPARALIVVLSDLHCLTAVPQVKNAVQRHDCCILQLRDAAEVTLRGTGLLRGREAETGRAFVTHGRKRLLDHQATATEFKRAGVDHLVIDVDEPYAHRLRQFFQFRDLLGRGAR